MGRIFQPAGQAVELRRGDAVATVVEVGGGLRDYLVGDRPVLDGYAAEEMASAGRGQVLLPWPNRVDAGRWRWDDRDQQLPITEVGKNNANHGLVRWAGWHLEPDGAAAVVAEHVLHPQTGYPFRLSTRIHYALTADGLRVELRIENLTNSPAPVGVGFHPYLSAGGGPVDACTLEVPAETRFEVDDRGLPTGRGSVAGSEYDFRQPRRIGDQLLDTPYTDLQRTDGLARVRLRGPAGDVTLWMDETFAYTQVFTGDTVPQPERRRRGLAVEPMTCPANALVTGDGLVVLEPAEVLKGSWGITPG
jgi:aldose 1-epimerase